MSLLKSQNIAVERKNSPVLSLPDIDISEGEHALLLGASGCGKTTLLSVLAGLLPPARGEVIFKGHDIYTLKSRQLDKLRGENFGLIFQTLHLLPTLSVRQNISLAAGLGGKNDAARINRLLTSLGLAEKADRKPDALSQGEQQRAAIARGVLNNPAILLADEPTSALDDENASIVADLLISSAREANAALIVATHDIRLLNRFTKIIRI